MQLSKTSKRSWLGRTIGVILQNMSHPTGIESNGPKIGSEKLVKLSEAAASHLHGLLKKQEYSVAVCYTPLTLPTNKEVSSTVVLRTL